jgi:hypothetical protein
MSLWVKRAKVEATRRSRWVETLNRIFPLPFEERRSRVGVVTYKTYRWYRFLPWILPPMAMGGIFLEARDVPHDHIFTSLHIYCADMGMFRHDTIKALNPAFEHERLALDNKLNDRKWRFTGGDGLSEREAKEFAAININRATVREGNNVYGL